MNGARKARLNTAGFTIVETLIVLAVTMAIFASVLGLISGRQQRTEFSQTVNDIRTRMQQSINEVSSGYYPNTNNFSCVKGIHGATLRKTVVAHGANDPCIFLGKAIQFGIAGTDPEEVHTYTIAGLRLDATGNPLADLVSTQSRLIAIGPGDSTSPGDANYFPDAYDKGKLLYGLTTVDMYYDGIPGQKIGALAFVSSLGSDLSSGSGDGSQQVNVVALRGTARGATKTAGVGAINTALKTSANLVMNPAKGVQICFKSGGTNQSALMNIGGSGRQLSVDMAIKDGTTC